MVCVTAEGRRIVRQRKVSTKIAAVTDADRRNAATARLEALETDHDTAPTFQDSDDEFVLEDSDEGSISSWQPKYLFEMFLLSARCAAQMNLSWERAVAKREAS